MLVNIIVLGSVSNPLYFASSNQAMHVTSPLQICLTSETVLSRTENPTGIPVKYLVDIS